MFVQESCFLLRLQTVHAHTEGQKRTASDRAKTGAVLN